MRVQTGIPMGFQAGLPVGLPVGLHVGLPVGMPVELLAGLPAGIPIVITDRRNSTDIPPRRIVAQLRGGLLVPRRY